MKKSASIFIFAVLAPLLFCPRTLAQGDMFGGIVQMDKTVHDFGDILLSDGPVTASFSAKNIADKPMVIYNVVTSCGCAGVEWTRQPIKPGESGTIKVTFSNDQGPYPFDKSVTVYFSGMKQPVILKLRGESHAQKPSLPEMYRVTFGSLAFKEVSFKAGNLSQGQQKSGEIPVANLGPRPLSVSFRDVSPGLALQISPDPLPAEHTGRLTYTITADRSRWGKNWYYATPVVDGKTCKAVVHPSAEAQETVPGAEALRSDPNRNLGDGQERIGIFAITKEDFSSWTKEQRDAGSRPMFAESTCNFGRVKAGTPVTGSYAVVNQGKSTFEIYKVDSDSGHVSAVSVPAVAAGGKGTLRLRLDTTALPEGEALFVITLYTNSPLRPVVNLFLSGWIE